MPELLGHVRLHLAAEEAAAAAVRAASSPGSGSRVGRQNFCYLCPLLFRGIAMMDHSISVHHDLHDIAAARTTHANSPAIG